MKLEIKDPKTERESSETFHQMMLDAMAMSYYKYGPVRAGFPDKVDAIKSLELRLKKYKETGNREFLVDVANFAMIEFMYPKHPDTHFITTDARESPGRIFNDEKHPSRRSNTEENDE